MCSAHIAFHLWQHALAINVLQFRHARGRVMDATLRFKPLYGGTGWTVPAERVVPRVVPVLVSVVLQLLVPCLAVDVWYASHLDPLL